MLLQDTNLVPSKGGVHSVVSASTIQRSFLNLRQVCEGKGAEVLQDESLIKQDNKHAMGDYMLCVCCMCLIIIL